MERALHLFKSINKEGGTMPWIEHKIENKVSEKLQKMINYDKLVTAVAKWFSIMDLCQDFMHRLK